jgi:hypothetical protein
MGAGAPGSADTRGGRHAVSAPMTIAAVLTNRDTDNAISLHDTIEDVTASYELTEDGVAGVEVWLW